MFKHVHSPLEKKRSASFLETGDRKDRSRSHSLLDVPANDDGESSQGDASSPETAPEPEARIDHQKIPSKHPNKKKKKRQPRIIRSPPSLDNPEEDKSRETSGRKAFYSSDNESNKGIVNRLPSTRLEKTPSFKRRLKPGDIEIVENKENRKSSVRSDPSRMDRTMNLVLLGDMGVGKTALAVRFVTRRYLHEYDPTLERTYEKSIQCSGEQVYIKLYDTYNKKWDYYSDEADGFIVMYSRTSSQSQSNAINIVKSIRKSPKMKTIPVLLLGNKSELQHAKKVSTEESEKLASANACVFREVSIADTINVDTIIGYIVRQILAKETGRNTPCALTPDQADQKSTANNGLSRKPSNAKHKMKSFLKW